MMVSIPYVWVELMSYRCCISPKILSRKTQQWY